MPNRTRASQLQRSIIICSACGILITGVVVAAASILPIYDHLKRVQESHLEWVLTSKIRDVEAYLARSVTTASRIASIPEIKKGLEDYDNGVMSRDDLATMTHRTLSDAMRYSGEVVGISRFDRIDELLAQVGERLPESVRPETLREARDSNSAVPVTISVPPFVVLITSILNGAGKKIGTDFVLIKASALEQILEAPRDLGNTGKVIVASISGDRITPIFSSRAREMVPGNSPLVELALKRAATQRSGVLFPDQHHPGSEVVAYAPLRGAPWSIALKVDAAELYAPVYPHILSSSAIIGILILAGTFGMILLVRPLAGKMVIHADEMERQVQEKVKIIDGLYEHIVQSEKSKAVAEHTAEVAHELRQPLAIVGGFARRMAKHFDCQGTWGEEQKESCAIIISEIQRLEKILGGLIDFTRKKSLHLEKVHPHKVIQDVVSVYKNTLMEKSIKLELDLAGDVGEIALDPNRFEQVVRNLVSNAIEASPVEETIRIQTSIYTPSPKARQTGELESDRYFEVTIHNHGPAIPPEHLHRIFSPFFTTKEGGNGLGLTVSKKIVEDHNGSISVKSDQEGTAFTVWLPVEREFFESTERIQ